ncbi:putative ribonuclease H-like domain-containing protein [Tanacetum coccineum]
MRPWLNNSCKFSVTEKKALHKEVMTFVQGGIVKFRGGDGRISGKGTIRTSKLDFENVYYVEELQHFNLFSVSQICDKRRKKFSLQTLTVWCLKKTSNYLMKVSKSILADSTSGMKDWLMELKGTIVIHNPFNRSEVAERKNRTLIEAARTMLADSKLPTMFWTEAVSTACYVLNRVSITNPHNKTPYELISGKVPQIGHLKPFGCQVTILNTSDQLGKFEGKADEFMQKSLGYASKIKNIEAKDELHDYGYFDLMVDILLIVEHAAQRNLLSVHLFLPDFTCIVDGLLLPLVNHWAQVQTPHDFHSRLMSPVVGRHQVPYMKGEYIHPQSQISCDLASPVLTESRAQNSSLVKNRGYQTVFGFCFLLASGDQMDVKIAFLYGELKEESWLCEFEVLMKENLKMGAMGEMTFPFKSQVKQLPDGISISQEMYVRTCLPRLDNGICQNWQQQPYEACRSRHQVTPLTSHLNAVKKIFKYLKGQPKLGLWYPKDSPFQLEAYSDSDYAGSHGDRKSTTGGCQFLGRRLISWQCKKQTIVATSSTEAEYVAAASCCAQVLWIQNQLLDYGFNFMNTKIFIDNQSTICIVKNPVFHQRTKHIEIRHHFIRDANEKNLIQVLKIHTDDNVADLLTKAFDGPRFAYLVVHIGMVNPSFVVNTATGSYPSCYLLIVIYRRN